MPLSAAMDTSIRVPIAGQIFREQGRQQILTSGQVQRKHAMETSNLRTSFTSMHAQNILSDKEREKAEQKAREAIARQENLVQERYSHELSKLLGTSSHLQQAHRFLSDGQDEQGENVVGDNSVVTVELTKTLREFSSAARSIRNLSDYLSRHPEALIRGKGEYNR